MSIDKVIVCGSPLLESYRRDPFAKKYISAIHTVYERCRDLDEEALRTALLQQVVTPASKYSAFHHVLTELAFLEIRQKRKSIDHDIVLVSLGGGMMDYLEFPEMTNLRLEVRFPLAVEYLHPRFFKLLRLIFTNKHGIIGAFEKAYVRTTACLENTTNEMPQAQISQVIDSSLAKARSELKAQENSELRNLAQMQLLQANCRTSEEREKHRDALLGSLPTVPYRDRKDRNPARIPDTCLWFIKHQKFLWWQAGQASPLLWVTALPGCGKSVLLRYLIDHFLKAPRTTICYFFFKDDSEAQRSVKGALRCILHQILLQHRDLLNEDLLQRFARSPQLCESFADLWSVLLELSAKVHAGEILLVIDALDECNEGEREKLIDHLVLWNDHRDVSNRMKILVSSRLYTDIRRGFIDIATQIHLSGETDEEVEQISKEIDLVIDARLLSVAPRLKLSNDHCRALRQALANVPQKTYLWAHLVLDEIGKDVEASSKSLQTIIDTLPKTVYEAYEKILSRGGRPERAKKMLAILLAVREPLNLLQLSEMWAIEPNTKRYLNMGISSEEHMVNLLRGLCGLFVIVSNGKVHFLHQTAREFLLRSPSDMKSNLPPTYEWKGSIVYLDAHADLVRSLLLYLNIPDLSWRPMEEISPSRRQRDMTHYARDHFLRHFSDAAGQLEPLDLELHALLRKKLGRAGTQYLSRKGAPILLYPYDSSNLIVAAWLGAIHLVQWFLDKDDVMLDQRDPRRRRTALQWATCRGHVQVAQLLMEHGADSTLTDKFGKTALAEACDTGNTEMVRMLLRFDGSVVSLPVHRHTLLVGAIFKGMPCHEIAIELLKHGADLPSHVCGYSLLHSLIDCEAVGAQYKMLWESVLAKGADVNEEADGQTVLDVAAVTGHIEIVPLLLQHGAVTGSMDGKLALAALLGRTELLRSLVDENPSMLRQGIARYGMSLVELAAISGSAEAVRMLMENGGEGADITAEGWLERRGFTEAVQLLRDEKARFMASQAS